MKPKSFNRNMKRELISTLVGHGIAAGVACVATVSAWAYARWWTVSLITGFSTLLRLPARGPDRATAHA